MAQLAAMLAEMALTVEQCCYEVATREEALTDEADKQRCHEVAAQEKALANNVESQRRRESAARAAALVELVSAMEQSCQESADHPAVLAKMTLANKRCFQKEARNTA